MLSNSARHRSIAVASIIGALLAGKWIAAWGVGRAFGFSRNE
jgi:hypothetical protein